MSSEVTMPRLDESMEEGTILKWLVEQGGEVKKGEPLVEIETDKSNTTYDAEVSGKLVEIVAKEGDTLAVGKPIARVEADGDDDDAAGVDTDGDGDPDSADADSGAGERDVASVSPIAERIAEDEG